jgi:hypothetical protein
MVGVKNGPAYRSLVYIYMIVLRNTIFNGSKLNTSACWIACSKNGK